MVCILLLLLSALPCIVAHGNMVHPPTWFDAGGEIGMKPGQQCHAGHDLHGHGVLHGSACMWYSNYTFIPGEQTLDPTLWTYPYPYFARNPWRAPGHAPVWSPCGAAGGNPRGCPPGSPVHGMRCPFGGYSYGPPAEVYPFPDVVTTEWEAGSVAEVAWALIANHGGGYSYRLCKVPEEGVKGITEECFQKTPLQFHGDTQWVQYGTDRENRTAFKANRTTEGTFPIGSQWSKVPIPACRGPDGGFRQAGNCVYGTQFPPPAPGLFGFGARLTEKGIEFDPFEYSIVDELIVSKDLVPGEYILSFRWDAEQTSQIWNTCSNIKIV